MTFRTERRSHRVLTGVVLGALVLAACGGGGTEGNEGPVELVFRQQDPPAESTGLQEMVDAWNRENPDVQVRMESAPWGDARQQFVREAPAGEGPDVLQVGFTWTPELAEGGLLVDLSRYVQGEPPGRGVEDFIGQDLATREGSLYAVPWTVDTGTIVYRSDALAAAGVPGIPRTWQEFQDLAVRLSGDWNGNGQQDYGFCFNAGAPWFVFNAYLWSQGQDLVTGTGEQARPGISDADLASAIQYFNSFFERGATPESNVQVREYGDPELVGGLSRGDCVMSFLPIGPFEGLQQQQPDLPLASAPMPAGSAGSTSFLGGRALGISAASQHPDEAYRFVRWLTQEQLFAERGYPWWPAQESLVQALEFPESQRGFEEVLPTAQTFAKYLETGIPLDGLSEVTSQQLSAVFSGAASPQDAAAAINARIQALLEQS